MIIIILKGMYKDYVDLYNTAAVQNGFKVNK